MNRWKPLTIRRPACLIVAAALVLAACGGEDAADETTTTTESIATTSTTTDSDGGTIQPGAVAPELVGTNWSVVTYSLAASMTNPWPGTELTLRFGDDGTVSGSTGCNEYRAMFEVEGPYDEFVEGQRDDNDGQVIRFGALTITERACAESNYMEQEAEFVDLLEKVGRWFIARGNLILRAADASFLIEAEPIG